jgi:CheY-like chemotaxis protein
MAVQPGGRGHVLVVEDNQVIRMVLTRALRGQGHMVATAEDGRQALDLLRAAPPAVRVDVILLDIVMPEMDGFATLAALQQDPALRAIPVIMISSVDEMDAVSRCIELGAADYIPKPLNAALLRALEARIAALLAAARLRLLERDYQEHAERIAAAAAALEAGVPAPPGLDATAARPDALGRAAQALQRLASAAEPGRSRAVPG